MYYVFIFGLYFKIGKGNDEHHVKGAVRKYGLGARNEMGERMLIRTNANRSIIANTLCFNITREELVQGDLLVICIEIRLIISWFEIVGNPHTKM